MSEFPFLCALFFIFGSVIGSFLNVCIVRMPKDESVILPASHCPACKQPLSWYHNVPLLSYMFLMGRCAHCKASISFRYFLVELLTAVSFAGLYRIFGLQPLTFAYLFMAGCFIIATFVDFEHRIIPDEVSIGGMAAGLLFSIFIPTMHGTDAVSGHWVWQHISAFGYSVLGVLAGGGMIYVSMIMGDFMLRVLRRIGVACRRHPFWRAKLKRYRGMRESMGGGDLKLMAMVGAFLGWEKAVLTFFIAPFFGAVYGIIEKIRTKESYIAYGPFLILGALVSLFWGQEIIHWVVQLQSGYYYY